MSGHVEAFLTTTATVILVLILALSLQGAVHTRKLRASLVQLLAQVARARAAGVALEGDPSDLRELCRLALRAPRDKDYRNPWLVLLRVEVWVLLVMFFPISMKYSHYLY